MKSALLIATLFFALSLSTGASDYTYSEDIYMDIIEEQIIYADRNTLYNGYTVNQLGEGYSKPDNFSGKVIIDIPVINQNPELPSGCEITSSVSVLNYLGYNIDKEEFTDTYISCKDDFYTDEYDILHGPDPYKYFIGDTYGWGFGCYANVMAESINKYFKDINSQNTAIALRNVNIADLEKLIDEGVPLIVWASQEMEPYNYQNSTTWLIYDTNEEHTWLANTHVLILAGYDKNCYYFMNPNDKTELTPYPKQNFLLRWIERGCNTIAIKLHTEQ